MLLSEGKAFQEGGTGQVQDAGSDTGEVPGPKGPRCGHRGGEGSHVSNDRVSVKLKGQEPALRGAERGWKEANSLCGQTFL